MGDSLKIGKTAGDRPPSPRASWRPKRIPLRPRNRPWCLVPPAPVAVVEEPQATGAVKLGAATLARLDLLVAGLRGRHLPARRQELPKFEERISDIRKLGDDEIKASAQVSSRLLERPVGLHAEGRARGLGSRRQQPHANFAARSTRSIPATRATCSDPASSSEYHPVRRSSAELFRALPVEPGPHQRRRHRPSATARPTRGRTTRTFEREEGQPVADDGATAPVHLTWPISSTLASPLGSPRDRGRRPGAGPRPEGGQCSSMSARSAGPDGAARRQRPGVTSRST